MCTQHIYIQHTYIFVNNHTYIYIYIYIWGLFEILVRFSHDSSPCASPLRGLAQLSASSAKH